MTPLSSVRIANKVLYYFRHRRDKGAMKAIHIARHVASLIFSDKLRCIHHRYMSIENGDRPHGSRKAEGSERPSEPKKFDRRTGKEVVTEYPVINWRPGQVLRALSSQETRGPATRYMDVQMLGGDPFEWVPANEVDIIEDDQRSSRKAEGSERPSEPKKFDRRTGKEVVTEYPVINWRPGQVLRALSSQETRGPATRYMDVQMLGGDPFEWVPANEVDIIEDDQ